MTVPDVADLLILLFVYLFGGAIRTGTEYVTYSSPGCCCCARASVLDDGCQRDSDLTQRARRPLPPIDVSGAAFLAGHVVASVARNALDGARPRGGILSASGRTRRRWWLAAAGMLALFVLAISWFAAPSACS